jgi:glyoxalase family protein
MRLVKKSVNQDDPGTYHLFYADAEGRPGSDLTFFPWSHLAPPRLGHGLAVEVGLEVPGGSLGYWGGRLEKYGARIEAEETRFGERVLPVTDPHGLRLTLVEATDSKRPFTPWDDSPVEAERQIRGLPAAASGTKRGRRPRGFHDGARGRRLARKRLDALWFMMRGGRLHPRAATRPAARGV